MRDILSLPEELLLVILRSELTTKDLCNVALVCNYFFKIASDPSLWTHVTINKRKLLTSSWENAVRVFDIPRYKRSILDLSNCHKMSPLRRIDILRRSLNSDISERNPSGLNLLKIPRGLLAKVVSRSTKANLNNCGGLRPSKLLSLFTSCAESTTLKELHLENVDLLSVPSDLLTKTIQRLEKVTVLSCNCGTNFGINPNPERSLVLKEAILSGMYNSVTPKQVNIKGPLSPEDWDRLLHGVPPGTSICPSVCLCMIVMGLNHNPLNLDLNNP